MGKYNKLVRDKIPAIIRRHGETPLSHVLEDDAFKHALLDKLIEEAIELRDSKGSIEERADVAEILRAIDAIFVIPPDELERVRAKKVDERGAFDERIFLEGVEE